MRQPDCGLGLVAVLAAGASGGEEALLALGEELGVGQGAGALSLGDEVRSLHAQTTCVFLSSALVMRAASRTWVRSPSKLPSAVSALARDCAAACRSNAAMLRANASSSAEAILSFSAAALAWTAVFSWACIALHSVIPHE